MRTKASTKLFLSIFVVLLGLSSGFAQIQITAADAAQWKAAEYYQFIVLHDSVPAFSLTIGQNKSNNVSMIIMPKCTTLDLNAEFKTQPDSFFRYGVKIADSTEAYAGFGTYMYKLRETTVNSYGEITLPQGIKTQYVGVKLKIILFVQSNQMTVVFFSYRFISKEYGLIAEFNTLVLDSTELFKTDSIYTKERLFPPAGKSWQEIMIIKVPSQSVVRQKNNQEQRNSFSISTDRNGQTNMLAGVYDFLGRRVNNENRVSRQMLIRIDDKNIVEGVFCLR
ncbi:MAG: hypothetical protein PHC61_12155 [Chitinivibrionales bacterium]|nr:hypothetical protein [Chitinivibrionales bacterium]